MQQSDMGSPPFPRTCMSDTIYMARLHFGPIAGQIQDTEQLYQDRGYEPRRNASRNTYALRTSREETRELKPG